MESNRSTTNLYKIFTTDFIKINIGFRLLFWKKLLGSLCDMSYLEKLTVWSLTYYTFHSKTQKTNIIKLNYFNVQYEKNYKS